MDSASQKKNIRSAPSLNTRLLITILILFFTCHTAFSESVPYDLQAKFLFTILSHDQNLTERTDRVVTIGVLKGQGAEQIKTALNAFTDKTVKGMTIKVIDIDGSDSLSGKLQQAKVAALYISGGQSSRLAAILAATGNSKTLSFASEESYIDGGVGIVIKIDGGKPKLVINLSTVKKEGVKLGAAVLRLAEVIE